MKPGNEDQKYVVFVDRWFSFPGHPTCDMKGLSSPYKVFVGQRVLFPGFTAYSAIFLFFKFINFSSNCVIVHCHIRYTIAMHHMACVKSNKGTKGEVSFEIFGSKTFDIISEYIKCIGGLFHFQNSLICSCKILITYFYNSYSIISKQKC